ncbi:Ephrin type-A receptor 10 [Hondaea fermentalgiana]|uniref:Ephrin type-A receptor 10 n=1 Tax=Hondaea fermentalgiana TaxID=2315210 RepID=A0A2R5G031_9STRA|nr:Ephrin type-A receptor 10 [Hondaea fermentalgiana]|eukprot:GBG24350.1 Ephrin type-A receptor 10 [Hondaea fermentalgiana]
MRASCVALVALILLLGPGEVDADDLVRYKCKELAILDVDQGTCACVENATLAPGNTSTCACDKGSYFEDALAACTGCPAGYYKNEIGNDESLCAPCPWPSSVSEDASTCVCPEDKGLIFEDEQMNCTCVRDVHVETVESVIRLPYLYEIGENVSSTKPIGLGNLFTISSGAGESSNATVTVTIIDGANKVNKTVELTQDDELAVPVSTENATLEIVAEPGCLWRDDAIVSVAVVPLGFSLTSIVENHTLFVEWTLYSTEWPVLHVYLERAPGLLDEIGSSRNGRIAWPIPSSGIGLDHDSTEADAKPIPRSIWLSVSQGAEVDPVAWSLEKAASTKMRSGLCGGNGTLVDLSGKCCSEIDAEGFCCESGTDVLGVCAGTAVLHNASAECGNGICEVGEACDNINDDCCADDCPFPVTYCTPEYGIGWSERTIREARAAGVSEYEMNNDIWAEFQKSFAS